MELKHFSHEHPLLFIDELSHESEKVYCLGCGQLVSGPSFGCVKCGFYLDKQCAEAPSELNHPFHGDHSFNLLKSQPYKSRCLCNFCKQTCENFVYHCSCNLDLHIKCALFSYNIAEKRTAEFQQIAHIDPLIATENLTEELKKAECFVCWKPLLDSLYFSPDCGFYLHAKCADLPAEINHFLHEKHPLILQFNRQNPQLFGFFYCCSPCKFVLNIECFTAPIKINQPYHRKHPLILQIVNESLPCQICLETTQLNDAVYFCSFCKFVLHVRCASSPPIIEDKIHHEHPFILLQRQASICDACGTSGNFVPYICSTCHLVVHKKCISLPRIIKFYRHQHSLSLKYFLEQREPETWECRFCFEEMNTEHGSYFCSKCNYMVHVNCATKDRQSYYEVDSTENDEDEPMDSREIVNATWIKHFYHQHKLALSKDIWDFKQCDGCLLHIFTSYYYCSQCDFFLHKACAELPMKKHLWFHRHHKLLRLISEGIFECAICGYETSGFAYTCDECRNRICLRCASVSDIPRCQGHEHPFRLFLGMKVCAMLVVILQISHIDVSFAILFCTITVSHCQLELNTNLMYIISHSLIMMMTIIQKAIFVTFVRKKETRNIGFTIVQLVTTQLIPPVFLENTHLSSPGASTQKEIIHILSLSSGRFIIIQNAKDAISPALIWLSNVKQLDAAILFTGNVFNLLHFEDV